MIKPKIGWGSEIVIKNKKLCMASMVTSNLPIDLLVAFCDLLSDGEVGRQAVAVYIDDEGSEYILVIDYANIYCISKSDEKIKQIINYDNKKDLAKELINDIESNYEYFSTYGCFGDKIAAKEQKKLLKKWLFKLKNLI